MKKRERLSPKYRDDRLHAHVGIQTWDEKQFRRVFRVSKRLFRKIYDKMVSVYPSVSNDGSSGIDNYHKALRKGENSTPWGPIILEVKLYIFLRMLAGASYFDMLWYGVHLDNVHIIFKSMPQLFKLASS